MKRNHRIFAFKKLYANCFYLTAIFSLILASPGFASEKHILVKPKSGVSHKKAQDIFEAHNGKIKHTISQIGVHVVELPEQANEMAIVNSLSKRNDIVFAEVDMLVEPNIVEPNDPSYLSQWHLPKIQSPSAWDMSSGQNITIAVLDTGVDFNHNDLKNQLVPGKNVTDSGNFTDDTSDIYGHGTMVAGLAAAQTNNSLGVASVSFASRIMPIRITNRTDGYATYSAMASGLTYAADHGARVANISFAGVNASATIKNAADYFMSKGGVVVTAAGNTGALDSSAASDSLVAVSSTTSADSRSSFSSYGNYVDISAPGTSVYSTTRGGGYGSGSGTSYAAPITAGVVALMMSANPSLMPSQHVNLLKSNSDDLGTVGYDLYFGYGRVNAFRAVEAAMNTQAPTDTTAPSVSILSPTDGSFAAGNISIEVNAQDNVQVAHTDLYVNGQFFARETTIPYSFILDSTQYADGWINLSAQAQDMQGNTTMSSTVNVRVANTPDSTPPTATFLSPTSGSTVSGNVSIEAQASDNIGISNLSLYIDNGLVATSTTSPLTFTWNTRRITGSHTLKIVAQDFGGNSTTQIISVTIGSTTARGKK